MKESSVLWLVAASMVGFAPVAAGQGTQMPAKVPGAASTPAAPTGSLTSGELDTLLGPIALYPDALLANVLAAAVYPDEVAEAAGFAKAKGDSRSIDGKSWEPPVKAIAKVPEVAKMMGEYMDWTTALGQAYLTQSQDVMGAVQRLRKKAKANGVLQSTAEQKVIVEKEIVYIQSSDPEVIYVPSYSPSVVYVDNTSDVVAAGLIGFGAGVVVGVIWADLACDWHHGCVGWGWGHHGNVDIDINRNINGNVNIGNNVNVGNRVGNGPRVGQEGGAWSPNRNKNLATARPSQLQNYKAGAPAAARPMPTSAGARPAVPTTGRVPTPPPQNTARAAGRTVAPDSARGIGTRTPDSPGMQRDQSAFRGGTDTRASANRGAASRQSSGGGARGGGGGARGGGGRR